MNFGYFPWDFPASMWLIYCLYNAMLCYQLLQIMVMNCNGMYYTLGGPSNIRPCSKCHALGVLLFTNDVELIIMKL